jgi:hypothetical protein
MVAMAMVVITGVDGDIDPFTAKGSVKPWNLLGESYLTES